MRGLSRGLQFSDNNLADRPDIGLSPANAARVEAIRAGISTRLRVSAIGFGSGSRQAGNAAEMVGTGGDFGRLYGLPEQGQNDI